MTDSEATTLCSIHNGDQRRSRAADIGMQVAKFWNQIRDSEMPEEIAGDCVRLFQDRVMTEVFGPDPMFDFSISDGEGME